MTRMRVLPCKLVLNYKSWLWLQIIKKIFVSQG